MNRLACVLTLWLSAGWAGAAEIYSNGTGGGAWSDPSSWRGNRVPGPDDEVFIRLFDAISFDKNDDGKISCRMIEVQPRGIFQFKAGAGKAVCVVAEGIVTNGAVKLDGTKDARDFFELRLVGTTLAKRKIKLNKGSGLLLYGKPDLPGGKKNVLVSGPTTDKIKEAAVVEVEGQAAIDWQRAHLLNVRLSALKLDNTGAKPQERIQLVGNRHEGLSSVLIHSCDTPVVKDNDFVYAGPLNVVDAGLTTAFSPLAEIKNNRFEGNYNIALLLNSQNDTTVQGNTFTGCLHAVRSDAGLGEVMMKSNAFVKCYHALHFVGSTGNIESTTVDEAFHALFAQNANLQVTGLVVQKTVPKGHAIHQTYGQLSLLNCNISPTDVKISQIGALVPPPVTVRCQQYVWASVVGAPEGSLLDLQTKGVELKPGTFDRNIRNTPVPIVGGKTPGPQDVNALIVLSWSLNEKGMPLPIPEYTLKILGPAPSEDAPRPLLKTSVYQPPANGFIENLNDAKPNLEVKVP